MSVCLPSLLREFLDRMVIIENFFQIVGFLKISILMSGISIDEVQTWHVNASKNLFKEP